MAGHGRNPVKSILLLDIHTPLCSQPLSSVVPGQNVSWNIHLGLRVSGHSGFSTNPKISFNLKDQIHTVYSQYYRNFFSNILYHFRNMSQNYHLHICIRFHHLDLSCRFHHFCKDDHRTVGIYLQFMFMLSL